MALASQPAAIAELRARLERMTAHDGSTAVRSPSGSRTSTAICQAADCAWVIYTKSSKPEGWKEPTEAQKADARSGIEEAFQRIRAGRQAVKDFTAHVAGQGRAAVGDIRPAADVERLQPAISASTRGPASALPRPARASSSRRPHPDLKSL
jgi:hypothetical protein